MRDGARQRGDDPDELPRRYARLINAAIADRPAGMTVCIHLCRGNFKSAWVAEGGYEPVAEVLFNELAVDGYFLEYDDERSGDFAPLRFVPQGQDRRARPRHAPSSAQLEIEGRPQAPHRRGGDATCRSTSCACRRSAASRAPSTATRSPRGAGAKLRLVVETAREVWGDAP